MVFGSGIRHPEIVFSSRVRQIYFLRHFRVSRTVTQEERTVDPSKESKRGR
jgi:hypothetical protein